MSKIYTKEEKEQKLLGDIKNIKKKIERLGNQIKEKKSSIEDKNKK